MQTLKPQDILVLLKLCSNHTGAKGRNVRTPSMALLGIELGISPSEVHGAIRRLTISGLLRPRATGSHRPNASAAIEFLVHGLKYVFPPSRGEMTRGVPTSYAASPLKQLIAKTNEPVPVWPYPEGKTRGTSFEPLYRTVPFAALHDRKLYELLAIADALREGRARERKIAEEQLRKRLSMRDVA